MILRGYQAGLVDKAEKALKKYRNTLCMAATGAGKTIMLSALAGKIGGRTLIIQHRQELIQQNIGKFQRINPKWRLSLFDASTKSWAGDAVFAMQQTLCRHTDTMPAFDHVITDEVHHIVSPTYRRIIDVAKERNPGMMLSGFTATPERADRKTLRAYFDNVADRITIGELVSLGFLVPPKAFIVDIGVREQLDAIKVPSAFGDQSEVADVLNTVPINQEIVRHWTEKAEGRQTIVFCSTVKHAHDVCKAFAEKNIRAEVVTGETPDDERRALLARFDRRITRVVLNVAVLTEGYDNQVCSCIILLRQCSSKSPLIQMAGRGLRTVDPELYPGVVKKDCVILDFGTSLLIHGDLDAGDGMHKERAKIEGEAVEKTCPSEPSDVYIWPDRDGNIGCGARIPAGFKACPLCGFIFEREKELPPEEINMMEFSIVNKSPFRWISLFESESIMVASGFACWAGVFSPNGDNTWYALGKLALEKPIHKLAVTGRIQALAAADDFMRRHSTDDAAKKSRSWLNQPASAKQIALLRNLGYDVKTDPLGNSQYTKYSASCHAAFSFNRHSIEKAIGVV
jgi:superfamily II DNA or RNA helicase